MPEPLSRSEETRRKSAVEAARKAGRSIASAAPGLGLSANSLRAWWLSYQERGPQPDEPDEIAIPAREIQDASFWRRKAAEALQRAERAEHLAHELAGVRSVPVDPVPWPIIPSGPGRSIGIVHTSDGHAGEVIRPGEIMGVNEFSPDIYRARMARLFHSACAILPRWFADDVCDGVLMTMAGDLTSGDIHEELTATNALTSHEQVALAVEVYDIGIGQLADAFGKVHVVAVPGNHGRTTKKPWAKLSGAMSYDTLIASILRDRFRGDARITWQISEGADAHVPIYGRTIVVTHGDAIGTGGGQGFAGPALPIVRGTNKVKAQAQSVGQRVDLILLGHFHTSVGAPGILANGSVPGYSEYGNRIRAGVEPPKQWIARMSMKWGLADRLDVQLDETSPRMKAKAA